MSQVPRKKFEFFNGGRGIDVNESHGDCTRKQRNYIRLKYNNTHHLNSAYNYDENLNHQHGSKHNQNHTQHRKSQIDPIQSHDVELIQYPKLIRLFDEVEPLQRTDADPLHHHETSAFHRYRGIEHQRETELQRQVIELHQQERKHQQPKTKHGINHPKIQHQKEIEHNNEHENGIEQQKEVQYKQTEIEYQKGIRHHLEYKKGIEHNPKHKQPDQEYQKWMDHQQQQKEDQHGKQRILHLTECLTTSPSPDSISSDSLYQDNTEPPSSPQSSEHTKSKRRQRCRLCANHNIDVDVKGHKWFCRFRRDDHKSCPKCQITKERQYYMAKQQKMTREQQNQNSNALCLVMDLASNKEYPRMKELVEETSNLINRDLFTNINQLIRLRKGQ